MIVVVGCVVLILFGILTIMFMHGATCNIDKEVSDLEQMKYLQENRKRRRYFGNRNL